MKLMPFIKKGFNMFIKDLPIFLITFLLFPIVMATIYGGMQKDLYEGKGQTIEAFKVTFQYNKNTEKGRFFSDLLTSKEVKKLIIEDSTGSDYQVIIDDDFKKVEIKGENEASTQFGIVKNFMSAITNNFNQFDTIDKKLNSLGLEEGKKRQIMDRVISAISSASNKATIKDVIVEGYKTLTSTEYYTISIFSFTSLMLVVTLSGYFYKEIKEGIVKRSLATPNDKRNYFIGFILNAFIISILLSLVYIIINRVRGIVFTGNIVNIGITLLAQSLLCAGVVGAIIAFIRKEVTANIIINIVIITSSIFGGVFFNSSFINSKVLQGIMNSVPNSLILNSYKGMFISGNLQPEVLLMFIIAIFLLIAAIVKIEIKWEVQ